MGFFVPLAAAGLARSRRCSGDSRCRKVVCRGGKRSVSPPIREYEGEIFTDYHFGEANTANKSDNQTNHTKIGLLHMTYTRYPHGEESWGYPVVTLASLHIDWVAKKHYQNPPHVLRGKTPL